MNPKGETGIGFIFAVLIFAVIALSLIGCKTPKTVTETVIEHVHDTVQVHHADTIKEVRVQTVRDTVRQVESHTYTLSQVGDTIKEVHHLVEREKVIVVDSTDRYKATVDSLRAALHEAKSKEKVVVKTRYILRWWEWGIVGVLAFVVGILILKRTTNRHS